jgi:hypothetical protein
VRLPGGISGNGRVGSIIRPVPAGRHGRCIVRIPQTAGLQADPTGIDKLKPACVETATPTGEHRSSGARPGLRGGRDYRTGGITPATLFSKRLGGFCFPYSVDPKDVMNAHGRPERKKLHDALWATSIPH